MTRALSDFEKSAPDELIQALDELTALDDELEWLRAENCRLREALVALIGAARMAEKALESRHE